LTRKKIAEAPPPRGEHISEQDIAGALAWVEAKRAATRPMTLDSVERALSETIKHDRNNKLIVFLSMLLNYTGQDQQNILLSGPSSSGKTHLALEVAKLFPKEDVDKLGYTSPTAFFHDMSKLTTPDGKPLEDRPQYIAKWLGEWEDGHAKPYAPDYSDKSPDAVSRRKKLSSWKEDRKAEYRRRRDEWDALDKVYVVSLEKRILIFVDQPHDRVLQVLRSLLSHDDKVLNTKITDKTKEGGHRTKNIRVVGFPTLIFASASFSMDEQERTRFWMLSPDINQGKLRDSLKLQAESLRDRDAFQLKVNANTERTVLRERIMAIKASDVGEVIIPAVDMEQILGWFTHGGDGGRRDLSPRDQRDFPRLIALAKAHALFNIFDRERTVDGRRVVAKREDLEAAKGLLNGVLEANRVGLPPYIYTFWTQSLSPLLTEEGISRAEFSRLYYAHFKDRIGDKQRKRIIDLLSEAGLVEELPDPNDKRKTRIYSPQGGGAENKNIGGGEPRISDYSTPPPGEYISGEVATSPTPLTSPDPTPTSPVEGNPSLFEMLGKVGEALRCAGTRGLGADDVAEGLGLLSPEAQRLLETVQRDGHAFVVPGGRWRWVA